MSLEPGEAVQRSGCPSDEAPVSPRDPRHSHRIRGRLPCRAGGWRHVPSGRRSGSPRPTRASARRCLVVMDQPIRNAVFVWVALGGGVLMRRGAGAPALRRPGAPKGCRVGWKRGAHSDADVISRSASSHGSRAQRIPTVLSASAGALVPELVALMFENTLPWKAPKLSFQDPPYTEPQTLSAAAGQSVQTRVGHVRRSAREPTRRRFRTGPIAPTCRCRSACCRRGSPDSCPGVCSRRSWRGRSPSCSPCAASATGRSVPRRLRRPCSATRTP